ncbi:MAG: PAS domain S-box protein, partial [Magnetovibrio sp.]|nr:PAS domain S-box protein [Magnetovibrio sp.]
YKVAARFTKYTNFSVVNADKYIVCSSGPLPEPKNVNASPNIIEAFKTKAFAISPFKFGILTGKPVLVFSKPLLNSYDQVVGTVNNGLSLTWLGTYLSEISRVQGQRMVVIDGQGTVMASQPYDLYELGSSIAGSALGDTVLGGEGGRGQYTDRDGVEYLADFARISRIPGGAYVVAFVPLEAVLAETKRDLYVHLGLLLALASASLFLGWVGARLMVLDPIDRLMELTSKVEEGDFEARSGVSYNAGELGTLAHAYDRMLTALETRTRALRFSEANYRELVESEEQLIHRYLPDTTEVFVNQELADYVGKTPQDLVGQKWIDYLKADERLVIFGFLENRTPEDPTYIYEHMSQNAQGQKRWLRWTNRAFFDDAGTITHFQAIAIDLTDRKAVEHSLEVAILEARAANRAKSNFLANMSHELRTPLNSIIGFSEMMSSGVMGGLPKQYAEYSTFITSSGHHLLNIINDILDLSKIEADMLQLDESEVNLRREISEVVMMIKDQAFKNNNQLLNKLDPTVELKLNGDRMRIKQVLLNVISNAVKFTHDGTISVDVIVADNAITLTITDTGIGMTDADIELALRPFGQVDGHHLNKRYEGTGLGLPLADKLMQMHDAKLSIESVPGEGTTVLLAFPQNRTLSAYTKLH